MTGDLLIKVETLTTRVPSEYRRVLPGDRSVTELPSPGLGNDATVVQRSVSRTVKGTGPFDEYKRTFFFVYLVFVLRKRTKYTRT